MPYEPPTTKPNPTPAGDKHSQSKKPSILEPDLAGLTISFDETEVGVGRHVYYLYSETANQREVLREFRRRFFKRAPADAWTWIVRGLSIHPDRHWPKDFARFPSLPDVLEAHWPG